METAHVMGKTGSEELVRVHCYFRGLVVVSQDMPGELRAWCVVNSMQNIGVRLSCPQRTLLDTFTRTQVWKDEIWQEGHAYVSGAWFHPDQILRSMRRYEQL